MCGFCGFTKPVADNESVIRSMMHRIIHRGPDQEGVHVDEEITMGFRRLSFIDLEDGSQPMYNEDKSVVVVYNGEIYNYQSLRDKLLESGHIFATRSDTEVLVHLYEEHGTDMLPLLRGMFAFALYDKNNGQLFCARDYFGIKPFYYYNTDDQFMFASEIKAFLPHPDFHKELNEDALENYLSFQYSVLPETFFKGVMKLMPAHYLVYKDGSVTVARYWEPQFEANSNDLEQTVDAIDTAVTDSIEKHKISDVEVGAFLSSGVDSSYVASCFTGAKTFTVGFDYDKYNEISYAEDLSSRLGIVNFNKTITTEEYWEHLPRVQYHMDEPLADPAAVALYFVSRLASVHVKGAMSGEGADEFFGGYNIYKEPISLRALTSLPMPIRKLLGKIAAMIPLDIKGKSFFIRGSQDIRERFIGNAKIFTQREREALLKNPSGRYPLTEITGPYYDKVKELDDITKMQYLDIHLWMAGDILLKADKMSMAHSLEVRVPFLDIEVFKTASKIPTRFRVNKENTKYAFRMAAERHLPEAVAKKKKLGFPVPIRIWLREDRYYEKVKTYFTGSAAERYFHTDKLLLLLDQHRAGKKDNSRRIWTVFMFLIWHEQFFEGTSYAI